MNEAEIRQGDVRSALRQLARDFSAGESRLIRLECVRQAVRSAGFGISEEACAYALSCLLQEITREELGRLRRAGGILPAEGQALSRRRPSDESIQRDFNQSDTLLEAWSALYHLYLRPDLGLDLAALERLLGDRHRRTLQRRVARGVQALTERLWQREHEARARLRYRNLCSSLPSACDRPYVGIRGSVAELHEQLFETRASAGLIITGPGGSGKTSVARALADRAIRKGSIQALTWLSASSVFAREDASPSTVASAVDEAWARMAGLENTLLVVDGLDRPPWLARLQHHLSQGPLGGRVMLIGRAAPTASESWLRWRTAPLSKEQGLALVRNEARSLGMLDLALADDDVLVALVSACEGLPLALLQAARALRLESPGSVARSMSSTRSGRLGSKMGRALWSETWPAIDPDLRRLVTAVIQMELEQRDATLGSISERLALDVDQAADRLSRALEAGYVLPDGNLLQRGFVSPPFLMHHVASLVGRNALAVTESGPKDSQQTIEDPHVVEPSAGPDPHGAVPSPRHDQAEQSSEVGGGSRSTYPPRPAPALPGSMG